MNPETLFCLNPACPAKGQVGEGNISVHSEQEGRCRCKVCDDTFSCRLLAVDGLASYVSVFQSVFHSPLPRFGQPDRPKRVAWQQIAIVQVVKQRTGGTLRINRRIVQGVAAMIDQLIQQSQGSKGVINTAYIERLNATFRQRLHWLSRRSRPLAQQAETLIAGMFIVGMLYNFCVLHQSLRCKLWITERRDRWVQRTVAMAAHLTDHQWSVSELLMSRTICKSALPCNRS